MDTIEFRVIDRPGGYSLVEPVISGVPLSERARIAEEPWAAAESNRELAGSYEGLRLSEVLDSPRHYLGEPAFEWFGDGDTVLLGCDGCGEWGCWPLTTQVEMTEESVTWSGFRQGHRDDWDLSALGPFLFRRGAYERAVAALRAGS